MDYGALLRRAWTIVWEHKYLMVLGILAAFSGSGIATPNVNYRTSAEEWEDALDILPGSGQFEPWTGVASVAIIALICIAFVIGLLLWAASIIARGGLIAGVDMIERGQDSTLGSAWRAGWQRGGTLIGIGLAPLIPALVLAAISLVAGGMIYAMRTTVQSDMAVRTVGGGLGIVIIAAVCVIVPIILILALLSTFANRACMFEGTGVWASYRRGWAVLRDNLGPALIIFLLQVAISIGLSIGLFIPGLIFALCCLLWPLLLLIHSAITAYFSSLWTLAWREWTL